MIGRSPRRREAHSGPAVSRVWAAIVLPSFSLGVASVALAADPLPAPDEKPTPSQHRAVEAPGLALRVPGFGYEWWQWPDDPNDARRHAWNLETAFEGVVPLGDRFGLRAGLSGSWRPTRVVSDRGSSEELDRGVLGWSAEIFWRDPRRGSLALAYGGMAGFSGAVDQPTVINDLWLSGVWFVDDFDLAAALGGSFGNVQAFEASSSGGDRFVELPLVGVSAALGATWYPRDWLSAKLALGMTHDRVEWSDALVTRMTRGGPELTLRALPPTAVKRWCVLETRLGYARSGAAFEGESSSRHRNIVEVGAALRLVFPGVPSLQHLARNY